MITRNKNIFTRTINCVIQPFPREADVVCSLLFKPFSHIWQLASRSRQIRKSKMTRLITIENKKLENGQEQNATKYCISTSWCRSNQATLMDKHWQKHLKKVSMHWLTRFVWPSTRMVCYRYHIDMEGILLWCNLLPPFHEARSLSYYSSWLPSSLAHQGSLIACTHATPNIPLLST